MKKYFTFFTLTLFIQLSTFSQVEITDIEPLVGDGFTLEVIQSEFDPGASGANAVWDYSVLGSSDFISDYDVLLPDDIAGESYFPLSTYVWVADLGLTQDLNFFMGFEDDEFVEYGYYSEYSGFVTSIIYSDPIIHLSAPVNYLDSSTDDYEGVLSLGTIGTYDISGDISYEVDAYGSLNVPNAYFPDALRVKTIETMEQELFVGYSVTTVTTNYLYYVEDYPIPVIIIEETVESSPGEPDEEEFSLTYLSSYNGVALSINESEANKSINIYPNPSSGFIRIDFIANEKANIKIVSIAGEVLKSDMINSNEKVDISDLPIGFYIAELMLNNGSREAIPFIISR